MELNKKNGQRILLLVASCVILYWGLNNLSTLGRVLDSFLSLLSPLLLGICIAYVVNLLLKVVERLWDKALKKAPELWRIKLKRPICLVLTMLLFLGIILGLVCLFATVLIVYYKQISEGYEDRVRFQIMQKVGMSRREVKSTINSQVLLVFFLPLVVAGMHLAFAFPILEKVLHILLLSSTSLFVVCSIVTFGVFAAVYTLIYMATARTYYKIVR